MPRPAHEPGAATAAAGDGIREALGGSLVADWYDGTTLVRVFFQDHDADELVVKTSVEKPKEEYWFNGSSGLRPPMDAATLSAVQFGRLAWGVAPSATDVVVLRVGGAEVARSVAFQDPDTNIAFFVIRLRDTAGPPESLVALSGEGRELERFAVPPIPDI